MAQLSAQSGNCDYVSICTFQNVHSVGFWEFTARKIDLWAVFRYRFRHFEITKKSLNSKKNLSQVIDKFRAGEATSGGGA